MENKSAKNGNPSFWLSATKAQARDTGMAMVLICLLIAQLGKSPKFVPLAMLILLINMIQPSVYKPLAKLWFGLSHALGTVMSKIILSVVFFVVLTPMGLLRKFTGKDPMQVACWKKSRESVFRVREHTFDSADVEQPF